MNLAELSLSLYLRNAPDTHDGLPLIKLENGRRIVIEPIEYDVTAFGDWEQRTVTVYNVFRLIGSDRTLLQGAIELKDIPAILAEESKRVPFHSSYRFSGGRQYKR